MTTNAISTAAVLGALAFTVLARAAGAAEAGGVSETVADLENRYSQTFVTGDVTTADAILASDFIGFGSNGKATDKATMLAEVRSEPHQASARITSLTVRRHGDTAVALGTEEDRGPGGTDAAHRRWLDTWMRTPAGWKLVASAEIADGR